MPIPSRRRRLLIATRTYVVVAVFGLALLLLRLLNVDLSSTETFILAALLAAPLALALFWEHIKGFKIGEMEITLAEFSLPIDITLAEAVQELQGSQTYQLVQIIASAIDRRDLRLVQVNLRSKPYWWSTRLFLLAALADEYTAIERLVFVDQDSAKVFLGLAAPHAVRRKLEERFPDYHQFFRRAQDNAGNVLPRAQVESIGSQWPGMFPVLEKDVMVPVTAAELREWLGDALCTEARDWDGAPATPELYAKILTAKTEYVPLLRGTRLELVVNGNDLARRIAESALADG